MAASPATLQFSSVDYSVSYSTTNQTKATVAVTRIGDITVPVTVDYTTTDLTAVAGTDYTQTAGTLSFASGEGEKTFDVSIPRNNPSQVNKVAILDLANAGPPGQAQLGNPRKATLTIMPPNVGDMRSTGASKGVELLFQYGIFGALGVIFVYFLMSGVLGDKSILANLADIETARGLITFFIAVGTIAIALILTISVIISRGTRAGQRFTQGKEVLTLLIGVLGTIVGFYFGTSAKATAPQPLQVSAIVVSNEQPQLGGKITITTTIAGGKPPYQYSIRFSPPIIDEIKGSSKDGKIDQEVAIPASIPNMQGDTEVGFQITVKDSEDKTVTKDSEKKLTIKKAPNVPNAP